VSTGAGAGSGNRAGAATAAAPPIAEPLGLAAVPSISRKDRTAAPKTCTTREETNDARSE
jgi:hypothetical protein